MLTVQQAKDALTVAEKQIGEGKYSEAGELLSAVRSWDHSMMMEMCTIGNRLGELERRLGKEAKGERD